MKAESFSDKAREIHPNLFYGIVKNEPDCMTSIANLHIVFLRGGLERQVQGAKQIIGRHFLGKTNSSSSCQIRFYLRDTRLRCGMLNVLVTPTVPAIDASLN
jgi:hypothetical protein